MTVTPARPSATPSSRFQVSRSSAVSQWASRTVEQRRRAVQDRGEAAGDLRLRPHDQAERHEIVQVPMTKKAAQLARSPGIRWPRARTSRLSASAANPTRPSTIVKGGSAATATLAKKNDLAP